MDGVIVAVAHDEFRGMGLSGVRGFLGAGAVVVDRKAPDKYMFSLDNRVMVIR
jgi:hypothetical protein